MNTKTIPPRDLLEHFLPAENASFELVRADGDIHLWKSTVTRNLPDGAAREQVKYHVTEAQSGFAIFFMNNMDSATAAFEHAHFVRTGQATEERQCPR